MTVTENTYTIILIVAIVILFTLYIVGLIRSSRASSTGRWAAIPALTLAFLLCVFLVLKGREIGPADWAQIMLLFGLVLVTGVYALSASKQADASVKMAKATVKPRLIPDFWITGDFSSDRYVRFEARIINDGNGPAYDIKAQIEDEGKPASVLASGDVRAVLAGHDDAEWRPPDPRLYFPESDKVQRRFFVIKYRDIDGEYEIRQPFVLTMVEKNRPFAHLESISRRMIRKINLEDELP